MADEENKIMADEKEAEKANPAVGFMDWPRKIKEHAETYPYVWGSYVLVYGGMGAYLAYRWRKLRRTEDRVRILQERLRKLVQAEESESVSASNGSHLPTSTSAPPPTPTAERS